MRISLLLLSILICVSCTRQINPNVNYKKLYEETQEDLDSCQEYVREFIVTDPGTDPDE